MKDIYLIVAFVIGFIVICTVLWCFFKGRNQENKMGWVTLPLIGVVLMSFPILEKVRVKSPQGEFEVGFSQGAGQEASKLAAVIPKIIQHPPNKKIAQQLEKQSKQIIEIQNKLKRVKDREEALTLGRALSSATDAVVKLSGAEAISAVGNLSSSISTSPPSN